MNEEQTKVLLKKSALQTTENFTESLMEQIDAKSVVQVQRNLPSIKGALVPIAALTLIVSFFFYYNSHTFVSGLDIIDNVHRTKLFIVLLLSVLFGVNYLLKMHHTSKFLLNN